MGWIDRPCAGGIVERVQEIRRSRRHQPLPGQAVALAPLEGADAEADIEPLLIAGIVRRHMDGTELETQLRQGLAKPAQPRGQPRKRALCRSLCHPARR